MIESIDIYNPADINLNRDAVIEASAGTGKTYTIQKLVVRLILEKGYDLSELLIVTFTEKATGELRERIHLALVEALEEFPDQRQKLEQALNKFNEAKIFTIHSFCQRVLQEFAFENSSSFNFELTQDQPIYQKILNQRKRHWQEAPEVCELLRENYSESEVDSLLCRLAASSSSDDVFIPFDSASSELKQLKNSYAAELKELSRKDFSAYPDLSSFTKPKVKYQDLLQPALEFAANSSLSSEEVFNHVVDLFPEKYAVGYLIKATSGKNKVNYDDELEANPHIVQLSKLLDEIYGLNEKSKDSAWCSFLKREIFEIKSLVKAYKRERSLLSFDDMIEDVYQSLKSDKGYLLKASLRKSLKVGLIDEFQDTDMLQWNIFKAIFHDDKQGESNRLMYIIGDPKQAIYRFRGADINAYLKARHELLESGANYYNLPVNWRSLPQLTSSFNQIFSGSSWFKKSSVNDWDICFRDSGNQDAQNPEFRMQNGPAVHEDSSDSKLINFIELNDPDEKDDWRIKKEITEQYVENIQALHQNMSFMIKGRSKKLSYGDICILIRKRDDFKPLEKAFQEVEIPFSFYKQSGIYQSSEAYALYYALCSFQEPGNSGFRKRAMVTDLFDVSAEMAVKEDSLADDHPVSVLWFELLELAEKNQWSAFFKLLVYGSGLLIRLHSTRKSHSAYVYEQLTDDLLVLAIDQNLTISSLAEKLLHFIECYEEAASDYHQKELEVDAVKVMTMHSSKGLEFPVVFLFGGFTPLTERSSGYHKYFDRTLQRTVIDLTKNSKAVVQAEADSEIIRLYYVACTRAVLKLFLPAINKKSILQDLFSESHRTLQIPETKDDLLLQEQESTSREPKPSYNFDLPEWKSFSQRRVGIYSFSSIAHYMNDSENVSFSEKELQLTRYDDNSRLQFIEDEESELILPRGAATGDLLHEILENLDYAQFESISEPSQILVPGTEVNNVLTNSLQKFPLAEKYLRDESGKVIDSHMDALARMLFHTLKAPIPELGGKALCTLKQKDTLREIEFNMRVPGSDSYLTGIIDLVLRVRKGDGSYIYYILDWKTTSVNGDYFRESLELSMREKKYKLQYELYSYAVQDWFENNFSSKHSLGGSIYIYLRGMNVNYPGRGVYYSKFKGAAGTKERLASMVSKGANR